MEIIKPNQLVDISVNNKKLFEQLLPELVKRLILAGNASVFGHRFPSMDQIWAPEFDGIANCKEESKYVHKGMSVWEFGTNANALAKINSDYDKRTKNSLGINKEDASFYLVVPKVWAYDTSITEWENTHNDWKNVKVYDAVVLCEWINSEPAVCAWLLDKIEKTDDVDFMTVSSAWNRFSNKTEPKFIEEMFLQCREEEKTSFFEIISNSTDDIKIKAETFIDATGFVLACLVQNEKIVDNCIVVNNEKTFNLLTTFSEDKLFFLNYKHVGELRKNNNRVIMCFNKEATSVSETIKLPLLTKSAYENALKKMGIPDGEVTDLFAFTHGNLRALIRRKPGTVIESQPDWAKADALDLLVPLVLLRNINKEKDCALVEKLSGKSFVDIEKTYHVLSMLEDSPIKIVHDHYVIVNYEEAWATLGLTPMEYHFDMLTNVVLEMIDELDSTGKYLDRQYYEYKNIYRRLVWNYIYYSYESEGKEKIQKAISEILGRCTKGIGKGLILSNLDMLATTDPECVMDFLNNNYYCEGSWLKELFLTDDYFGDYCKILWTLDELVIHQETFGDASKLLFEILLLDKEYNRGNSPEDSLLVALCLWRCEGTTTIEQKEAAFRKMLKKGPEHALKLGAKLIRKDSYARGVRIGEKTIQGEEITVQTVFDTKERIMDLLFQKAIELKRADILISIISNYNHVSAELISKYSDCFQIDVFELSEVNALNYWLRDKIFNIKRFAWDDKEIYLEALEKWIACTTYSDNLLSNHWIFKQSYECPATELLDSVDDYAVNDRTRYDYRKQKINEVINDHGDEGLIAVLSWIYDESWWGMFLASEIEECKFRLVLDYLWDNKKYNVLARFIDEISEKHAIDFLVSIGEEKKVLLTRITNPNLLCAYDENDAATFWQARVMYRYSETEYKELLKYNPCGLITYLYLERGNDCEKNVEMAQEIFEHLNDMEVNVNRHVIDEIKAIIAGIDEAFYTEEWAKTCYDLTRKIGIGEYPECVRRLIFEHPEMIKQLINSEGIFDSQFSYYYTLPIIAYSDYPNYKQFFDKLLEIEKESEVKYSMIGKILGKTGKGSDDWFPHDFTRLLLEDYDDKDLDIEVVYSFNDLHSWRTISDGNDQKQLYNSFIKKAAELQIDLPHTSFILKRISKQYEVNAKRDYLHSELIDY